MTTPQGSSQEKQKSSESNLESAAALIVSQPKKLEGLLETLSLIETVSERIGEDRSGDWSGSGSGQGGQQGDDHTQQSLRQLAIANLPEESKMRSDIRMHIEKEVKKLQREVRRAARRASKPGSAYKLNKLYARIRRLNGLLTEMLDAGYSVVKRFYIRIFVDKQSIS